MKSKAILAMLLAALAWLGANAQQIPTFTQVTQGALVTDQLQSWQGQWGDYDNDGRPDVLVCGAANQWRLYHNDGGATFSAVTTGVMNQRGLNRMAGAWADPDNDGDLDIYAGAFASSDSAAMYWNDGHGDFTRQPVGPSWTSNHIPLRCQLFAWGDFDRDGFLDAFLSGFYKSETGTITNTLLHNNGDGTFGVVTDSVLNIKNDAIESSCPVDYDSDGDLDLILVRSQESHTAFYANDGRGVFSEATPEPILSEVSYGVDVACADFDSDADLDVYFGAFESLPELFYINNGDGNFSDWAGQPERFGGSLPAGCDGPVWGDFDNDGFVDLYHWAVNRNQLWRNLGDGNFEEILTGSPVTDSAANSWWANWVDFNADGFLDLFVANFGANYLYQNNGNSNHWLEVKLKGVASDRLAVGAKIFVTANIRGQVMRQMRVVSARFHDQDLVPHFGLGDATNVTMLRIEWPIGIVQELSDITVDQILSVTEQQAGVTNTPGLTVSKTVDGSLQLTATGQTNLRYVFEASTNLVQWTKIAVRTNLTGTVEFASVASSSSQRFYRVVVP